MEPKYNIDISDGMVQWLGRKMCEREVMGLNLIGRVVAYLCKKCHGLRLRRRWADVVEALSTALEKKPVCNSIPTMIINVCMSS